MKAIKRLATIMVVAIVALFAGTTAFADTSGGTIIISDPNPDTTYRAYKIFDLIRGTDSNNEPTLKYTIDSSSEWFDAVYDETEKQSKIPGLEITDEDGNDTYDVKRLVGFSAASLADTLQSVLRTSESNPPTMAVEVSGQENPTSMHVDADGYYLVVSVKQDNEFQPNAALTSVSNDEQVTIESKNDMIFDKTITSTDSAGDFSNGKKETSVRIGDKVKFQIAGVVPTIRTDNPADTSYTYFVTDTMDAGLTFGGAVEITIGGNPVNPTVITAPNTLLTGDQIRYNDNGFELSLDMFDRGKETNDHESMAGKPVVIRYHGIVNEQAAGVVSNNKAVLEFGNDPNHLESRDSEAKVYTAKVVIDKFETGAPEKKLENAKFLLKNADGKYYAYGLFNDALGMPVDPASAEPGALEDAHVRSYWVNSKDMATEVVTDVNGRAEFVGLTAGDYTLVESAAPAGYTAIDDMSFTVSTDGATDVSLTAAQVAQILTETLHVSNTPGSLMPSTGGIGRIIFFVLAGIVAADVVYHVIRRRNSAE